MAKAKRKTVFVCVECGAKAPRWLGRCPSCGSWNTLQEERVGAPGGASPSTRGGAPSGAARPIAEVLAAVDRGGDARRSTGLGELDRVLGGGVVEGGVVLLGGEPGIGKSTLLMQALAGLGEGAGGPPGLYVSGEESAPQVARRGRRLGVAEDPGGVRVLSTTDLDDVLMGIDALAPAQVVIDSVQTVRSAGLDSVAGSVGQIREVAARLIEVAKARGIVLFLIGHVTKEGMLAGPKVLEHLVDTVLAFEGDASGAFRLVRATKNRFGAAQELGVFEMTAAGLREVPDPSVLFLRERPEGAAGSAVVPTADGSRPLLVEVQALVAPSLYGAARRVVSGLDANRLAILLAVLDRKADVHVLDQDVFTSIAGGARVEERALDLPLALAIVSSLRERPLGAGLVSFGEVGLAGEVRAVPRPAARLGEARKLGFASAILPAGNLEGLEGTDHGLELRPVRSLAEAMAEAFG